MKSHIKLFEDKKVRSVWNETEEKWYFSVTDVIEVLTGTDRPRKYWNDLKTKLKKEGSQLSDFIGQLKLTSSDGKSYLTDVADAKQLLRLIQSVPSPKAEPFKLWLAQVGSDRLDEIENPELAVQRTREVYKSKGYPDDWIEKRLRSIAIREELTSEWKNRDVQESRDYAILTAEISKATFGLTPSQYKQLKGLKRENLRDHMTDLELIFSMLGEASTTEIVRTQNPIGFEQNKAVAKEGGKIAGDALNALETKTGKRIVSRKNYLQNPSAPSALT
ncbi:BRO-N domain-containing protein [Geminisphaera colitermitum]|uniref:BRO-N domain-containing protein n=1 Tax=Geminisphaera colitermitum TaxID=1148786 RepID=UPI00019650E7|nr:Bro-N domain-containing protein [Geminisphaera colitermitum]